MPCGVNPMKSQVLYRAAQGLRGIKFVSARPKHGTDKSCMLVQCMLVQCMLVQCMLLQCMRHKSPLTQACFERHELTGKHVSAIWHVGAAFFYHCYCCCGCAGIGIEQHCECHAAVAGTDFEQNCGCHANPPENA